MRISEDNIIAYQLIFATVIWNTDFVANVLRIYCIGIYAKNQEIKKLKTGQGYNVNFIL